MVNPGRPPLPPNRLYHQPLNYHEYVKDYDPNAHGMYHTNFHTRNHNVETCRIKRKEDHVPTISKVTTQQIKI
jgi:hypothetical protein